MFIFPQLVTGGGFLNPFSPKLSYLSQTEILRLDRKGRTFEEGPRLPAGVKMAYHCQGQVNKVRKKVKEKHTVFPNFNDRKRSANFPHFKKCCFGIMKVVGAIFAREKYWKLFSLLCLLFLSDPHSAPGLQGLEGRSPGRLLRLNEERVRQARGQGRRPEDAGGLCKKEKRNIYTEAKFSEKS